MLIILPLDYDSEMGHVFGATNLLSDLTQWAKLESGINALALVGSYVRGTARSGSDIDLVVIADSPERYLNDPEWARRFGTIVRIEREDWGRVQSLRVVYADGTEIEFGIAGRDWANVSRLDEGTRRVVADGMKILHDSDGILSELETAVLSTRKRPTPSLRIATRRLRLVPHSLRWREDIFREFTPEITRYMVPKPALELAETESFIRSAISGLERGSDCTLVILDSGQTEFLGCVGLHRPHTRYPELGIWLKRSAHGKGYGREAIVELKTWADRNLDYSYLVYPVDRDNLPSRKIPESMGGKVVVAYDKMSQGGHQLHILVYRIDRVEDRGKR